MKTRRWILTMSLVTLLWPITSTVKASSPDVNRPESDSTRPGNPRPATAALHRSNERTKRPGSVPFGGRKSMESLLPKPLPHPPAVRQAAPVSTTAQGVHDALSGTTGTSRNIGLIKGAGTPTQPGLPRIAIPAASLPVQPTHARGAATGNLNGAVMAPRSWPTAALEGAAVRHRP